MKRGMNLVGQWYLRPDTQELFQVLDCDDRSGAVRIQMFDGSLDELEEESWRAMAPEPVEPPEDWTGPLDNLENDELDELGLEPDSRPRQRRALRALSRIDYRRYVREARKSTKVRTLA